MISCQNCGSVVNADESRKDAQSPSQAKRRTSLSRRGAQARSGLPNAFGKSRFSNNNHFDNQNYSGLADEYQTLPRQSIMTEENNTVQNSNKLEALQSGSSNVQIKKLLTLDPHQDQD